jgi:hypothetical protein
MAILRKLARVLKHFGIFEKYLNVGEHMIPYYGRHSCSCLFTEVLRAVVLVKQFV